MQNNRYLKEYLNLFILVLVLIFSNVIIKSKNSEEKVLKKISCSLEAIQIKHDSLASDFKNNFKSIVKEPEKFYPTKKANTLAIYLFKNDSLIYWNSDINDPKKILQEISSAKNIFSQGHNDYFVTSTNLDSIRIFTSTPLCHHNPNSENNDQFLPAKINGSYKINFKVENEKISCDIYYQPQMNKIESYIIGILLLIIFIKSLVILSQKLYKSISLKDNKTLKSLLFLIGSIFIYLIIIVLQNNLFISTSDLFRKSCLIEDCKYSFSLGALAEFAILFFTNITFISLNLKKELTLKNHWRIILSSFILIFIILSYTYLIFELISNINIPFSFLQIYNTTINSYIFLIIIGVLTCTLIILIMSLMRILIFDNQSYILSIVSLLAIGGLFEIIINNVIDLHYSLITNIVAITLYMIVIWEKKSNLRRKTVIRDICVITLMTIQLTYILYLINENKEREEMEWFANIVGDESDEKFEKTILEVTEKLKKDKNLIEWQKDNNFPSDDSILNYLNIKYFNLKEIKDYNKVVTLCDTSTILIIKDFNDYEINCNELFKEIVEFNYTRKISEELSQIDDPTTDSYYIFKLDLSPIDSNKVNNLYIEFYKEYILNYIGIPELITSHENVIMPDLVNYSFSSYEGDILQYKYGFYNYPNELKNFRYKNEEYVKTRIFKHLTKEFDGNKTIIVTIEKPRFIDIIAPFSYIFLVLSIMYYLYYRLSKGKEAKILRQSFHGKMQLTIILTLGFSFLVAGFTSFIFIRNSLNRKTTEFQYEKNKTIVKTIEDDFNKIDIENPTYLKRFKENHFTDINIYDLNGNLLNTTQPKLFEKFKSKIINRKAYETIKERKRMFYSCEENIEGTKYNSSYFPLKDKDGNIHAIINIPYFDNKMTSRSSVSNFIITYLNIIIVLMGASALVVILMTRRTIKPLEIIQDKMQKISLGEKNEVIEWKSKDEIGELIESYNKLIKELEISANKLMRSERETAWREMARQVAHEIKNPLTPMKLNIQFLQMAWDEKNPDIDRKLRETTKSILEQIEILSNIASAFSDYAKLPKKNIEEFDIKELILNTINLYNNNENININFIEENASDYEINSDKNNLSIVFGNILKNAIQAIGKKEDGLIEINIKDSGDSFLIKIKDNGCGIGEEEKKKIFMPNFTTKSSGMGVGLSIVYDILEMLGGSITFESELGIGTTFFVEIRKR